MADDALDSLRVKANRPKRADTIKGRKRNQTPVSDNVKSLSTGTPSAESNKPAVPSDKPKTEVPVVTRDDEKGSDGNNTSTESDETAHGRSLDDENADDDTATISAGPAEVKGVLQYNYVSFLVPPMTIRADPLGQPTTVAVSVVIIAIVGYAYLKKMKE
jgi:hypothetical protein